MFKQPTGKFVNSGVKHEALLQFPDELKMKFQLQPVEQIFVMETVLLEILNKNAYKLIKNLEALHIVGNLESVTKLAIYYLNDSSCLSAC